MNITSVTAKGKSIETALPCAIEEFLAAQNHLPRSVVVEHALASRGSRR